MATNAEVGTDEHGLRPTDTDTDELSLSATSGGAASVSVRVRPCSFHVRPCSFHVRPCPSAFNAAAYSLDALLPLVDLGQEDYWQPNPDLPGGGLIYLYYCFHVLSGWVLSLLFVAAVTGLVQRQRAAPK